MAATREIDPSHTEETGQSRPGRWPSLYVQVLIACVLGALVGYFQPTWGQALQPLADAFIRIVKMLIAPIIFTTVVLGLAGMSDLKKLGRVGWKALLYFELMTTIALGIGYGVAKTVVPGRGDRKSTRLNSSHRH